MRLSRIVVAVAAVFMSLGAAAQEKQEPQTGSPTPSMSEEQKPGADVQPGVGTTSGAPAVTEGKASGNANVIMQVQTRLNEQGYDVGTPDGKMGPKTRKKLKEFQASKGLKATGRIDQRTLSALGVSGSAAGGASETEKKY